MNEKIKDFIKKQHLLVLSVLEADSSGFGVYSASCYYAFDVQNLALLFKSAQDSRHIELCFLNPKVGINIAQDSKNIGRIQGVQIKARFHESTQAQKDLYYTRFPFAKIGSGEIFALEILWAKYTNNKLLLSNKITFTREK
ncbi:hypothetical protein [Helicobacter sp. MIT 05-5294]|uniref:hypothetical protein n=1 Tax=Helicobacter sp. MIT 05-5294 TaxID=1548150 RepID=UPI00051F8850|nr:hypothetical protein [Helicobacter sp. MIT 05-5294]TLD89257.1 hypothetical protein LS69_001135 [Helicobacter sp. MIT 05-5294]